MNGRDARNLSRGLIAEWAVESFLRMEPGPLPRSFAAARGNGWRDGGVDVVSPGGVRIDVKASTLRYPELMVPLAHRAKFAKPTCPVDWFMKATVQGPDVTLTCCERRPTFLANAHVDDARRYPYPTLWLAPHEATPVGWSISVPLEVIDTIDEAVREQVPDQPWKGWLTL